MSAAIKNDPLESDEVVDSHREHFKMWRLLPL